MSDREAESGPKTLSSISGDVSTSEMSRRDPPSVVDHVIINSSGEVDDCSDKADEVGNNIEEDNEANERPQVIYELPTSEHNRADLIKNAGDLNETDFSSVSDDNNMLRSVDASPSGNILPTSEDNRADLTENTGDLNETDFSSVSEDMLRSVDASPTGNILPTPEDNRADSMENAGGLNETDFSSVSEEMFRSVNSSLAGNDSIGNALGQNNFSSLEASTNENVPPTYDDVIDVPGLDHAQSPIAKSMSNGSSQHEETSRPALNETNFSAELEDIIFLSPDASASGNDSIGNEDVFRSPYVSVSGRNSIGNALEQNTVSSAKISTTDNNPPAYEGAITLPELDNTKPPAAEAVNNRPPPASFLPDTMQQSSDFGLNAPPLRSMGIPPGLAAPASSPFIQYTRSLIPTPMGAPSAPLPLVQQPAHGGRRKIKLHLQEDIRDKINNGSFLGHIRRRSKDMFLKDVLRKKFETLEDNPFVDRGSILVSWFEGTTSQELIAHVRRSLLRKLQLQDKDHILVKDLRILDVTENPPEEIVLSPYIPDGSRFLLRFCLHDVNEYEAASQEPLYGPPVSPSAAPSPPPASTGELPSLEDLSLLRKRLNSLSATEPRGGKNRLVRRTKSLGSPPFENILAKDERIKRAPTVVSTVKEDEAMPDFPVGTGESALTTPVTANKTNQLNVFAAEEAKNMEGEEKKSLEDTDSDDDMMLHSDDPIETRLREVMQLLYRQSNAKPYQRTEKKEVIFVLANYFVLFISFIALSAEIHARAPGWLSRLEAQMTQVQDCAANQEALFECVSNGDFAGLIASVVLWLSRSGMTKHIFLFGFGTPRKLWTVVYESFVTAFCWGVSYLFIRRGLNPDTRPEFLRKYWKDAVYGSLAGFNAAFLKQVLKNLIPEEAVEDALRDQRLKILKWISF